MDDEPRVRPPWSYEGINYYELPEPYVAKPKHRYDGCEACREYGRVNERRRSSRRNAKRRLTRPSRAKRRAA